MTKKSPETPSLEATDFSQDGALAFGMKKRGRGGV